MNKIFDSMDSIYKLINVCKDFTEKIVMMQQSKTTMESENEFKTSDEDTELLQEEQNLTEERNNLEAKYETLKAERKQLMDRINTIDNMRTNIEDKICNINDKLEEIYKKWITKHPAQNISNTAKKVLSEPSIIRQAFEKLYDYYQPKYGDKEYKILMFKRFDNLCHGRCKTTSMFGYDWTLDNVEDLFRSFDHEFYTKFCKYCNAQILNKLK